MDVWGGVCTGDATAGQAQLNSPAGEGGRGTREGLWGVCLGPRAGRSPQFKLSMLYAGDTWLEDTEETSVLLWDTVEEVSSSPKGFLPQQIVVIMQLRNWGGDRNENGGTGGGQLQDQESWMDGLRSNPCWEAAKCPWSPQLCCPALGGASPVCS